MSLIFAGTNFVNGQIQKISWIPQNREEKNEKLNLILNFLEKMKKKF